MTFLPEKCCINMLILFLKKEIFVPMNEDILTKRSQ